MYIRRLACVIRGGHRWQKTEDSAGSFTSCARCGKLQHERTGVADPMQSYVPDADISRDAGAGGDGS